MMRLRLISCEVFEREARAAAAASRNAVDLEFLPQAPHKLTDREMVRYLQTVVDRAGRGAYHAVLLVSGSCKHGLSGLEARSIPLVLPRAKDCISLLLDHSSIQPQASRRATGQIHENRPHSAETPRRMGGVSTKSWILPAPPKLIGGRLPFALAESWTWREPFGVKPTVADAKRPSMAKASSVLEMLVDGYWNYAEFLVVPAGWRVVVKHDQGIIAAEEITP